MRRLARTVVFGCLVCGWRLGTATEPWNAPQPLEDRARAVYFTTFQERPKHLDPVSSYSENEALFTGQIYEPPLEYHYLKRPYTLQPLTVDSVPMPVYLDRNGQVLPAGARSGEVARAVYRLTVRRGTRFAPHPALARDASGRPRYHALSAREIAGRRTLDDFPERGTRELVAEDFVHQIKRLAHPGLHSPILGFMTQYIAGLEALARKLREVPPERRHAIDLREYALDGARVIDRYTFEIVLTRKYPQFVFWLAMPFFAPVPWEADAFYAQPGMAERNLSLDWHPLGTGPYMLTENNPNRRMTLRRNPEYRDARFPSEGAPGDAEAGYLRSAGARMPFIDEVQFILEKEDIPEWNKFLQGYYDSSAIAPDGFDQAVRFGPDGRPELTSLMKEREVALNVATQMSISYLGFNMLDPVVGGYSPRARSLRQAISIAIDTEEMISIFGNGRGLPAHGPLPPGIFGHHEGEAGINPVTHEWRNGRPQRRDLSVARALLADAGYPHGTDPATGAPLVLHFDATATGPDMKALLNWYRKQFARIGLDLVIRSSDYNRFQEKMQKGMAQIFGWGWNADYPDPENFLFLLYGPHGKARHHGENAANYANGEFDALFERMRGLADGPERQAVVDRMMSIVRADAPWVWGFHPQAYSLQQAWVAPSKPNLMARNTMKYRRLDPALRVARQRAWNQPRTTFIWLAVSATALCLVPAVIGQRRRRRATAL
ncbi:MAG: ABC transporter substrate-binding protein [Gammaproteobacteria bacterium]